ncbi:MAG: hypothetical protein E6H63_10215 [Betaproteobacteria bacterium]|nr:MAG: hypothetical protein E6H63_10215 [Betaproteobacteria bacterium]
MKIPSKLLIGLALAAAGVLGAGSAFAWHHGGPRVVFGFNVGPYWGPYWGAPYYSPYYYPAPVYYPAPAVVSPPAPAQYVERSDQPLNSGYWYYCETSRGYYPYVKECPSGWKAVPPAPAPAQ